LVSSQTGFNQYFRYVLPSLPYAFVWISKVAGPRMWAGPGVYVGAGALVCTIVSSLWCFPHNLSYFNEIVGGPLQGHKHLLDANIDSGQDLWHLRRWLDGHPEAVPICIHPLRHIPPRHYGLDYCLPPTGPPTHRDMPDSAFRDFGPQPGWYAISIHRIHHRSLNYDYFLRIRPVARAGYSINIYHITLEQANRVRREEGLPEIGEDQQLCRRLTGTQGANDERRNDGSR